MTNQKEIVDRRTVLRTVAAGTAALAGIGVAGTASADHIRPGQCARIIHDVQSWTDCYQSTYGPIHQSGTEGTIMGTCDDSSLVQFVPSGFNQDVGWIPDSFIEKC